MRPKSASSGGVSLKVEKAITQPVCLSDLQSGVFLKVPPTSLPFGTVTLPPSRIAEISCLRCDLLFSISVLSSWLSIPVPCEWPMRTTPRPLLYFFR